MESKNDQENKAISTTKFGRELSDDEIKEINFHRQRVFHSNDPISPSPENKDWNNLFFLMKNHSGELLSFGRLHSLKLSLSNEDLEVLCFSMVVSTKKGQGYGRLIMDSIKRYGQEQGRTIIGFCETDLLPFYRKCNWKILKPKDNHF